MALGLRAWVDLEQLNALGLLVGRELETQRAGLCERHIQRRWRRGTRRTDLAAGDGARHRPARRKPQRHRTTRLLDQRQRRRVADSGHRLTAHLRQHQARSELRVALGLRAWVDGQDLDVFGLLVGRELEAEGTGLGELHVHRTVRPARSTARGGRLHGPRASSRSITRARQPPTVCTAPAHA